MSDGWMMIGAIIFAWGTLFGMALMWLSDVVRRR